MEFGFYYFPDGGAFNWPTSIEKPTGLERRRTRTFSLVNVHSKEPFCVQLKPKAVHEGLVASFTLIF